MKLHYKGKFNGDVNTLPHGEHKPNAVAFKEPTDVDKFAVMINVVALVIMIVLFAALILRCMGKFTFDMRLLFLTMVAAGLTLFPHELLHAICFKHDVYLYTNFAKGMLFVVGPETMTKARFIFMSLLPSIVFGFIPYIAAMLNPSLYFVGLFGAASLAMGAGDFYNVYNALTQMPRGAREYLYKFNSFWYMPTSADDK